MSFFIAMKGDDRLAARKNPLADKAYELYKSGMKLVDIADQLNCSDATIRTWKNRYKWDDGNETFQKESETKRNVSKNKDKASSKRLTPKQEAFTAEYIKNGGNATQAAKDAGYSGRAARQIGNQNLTKHDISNQIAEQMERIEKEQHRDIMSLAEIQERRSMIAKGKLTDGRGYSPDFNNQLKAMDGLEKALTIAEKQRIEREEKEKRENSPLWTVPITDITSDFVEIYRTVHEAFAGEIDVHEIVSKGGRGSIKSNFWSDVAYEVIRQDPQAHVVYTRRYKVDLRGSVYNQFMKTVIRYNDLDNWDFKQSPLCAVYKPTGQTVMFVGADKPISLKSFNVPFGYVKLLIHEECDEMAGVEQMDNIEDTFLRSDTPALDIKIFNPPKSKNNFMNQYVEECKNKPQTRICHSYYYNVPEKWLGKRFFERAEWFKVHKPLYYRNNYMGEVTGTGGGIFDNVEERTITDAEIENMPFFHHGLDFGFEHPQTFEKTWYDEDTDAYVIEGNFLLYGKGTDELASIANNVLAKITGVTYRPFTADCLGNPCLEVGDAVRLQTRYKLIESYILKRTLKGIQAMRDSLEADGEEYRTSKVNGVQRSILQLKGKSNTLERSIEETKSTIVDVEKGLQSQITQTASEIRAEVKNTTDGLSSRITQNASSITAEVNRATSAEGTLSSKITQTAESITAEVSRATEKEGQLAAAIQVNAEGITSKVSRDSVVSEINQSAEGLKIRADLLELRGSVEMTGGYVHIDATESTDNLVELKREGTLVQIGTDGLKSAADTRELTASYSAVAVRDTSANTIAQMLSSGKGISSYGWESYSDKRLKHGIESLDREKSTALIQSLRPCRFVYNYDQNGHYRHGLIAQEVLAAIGDEDWAICSENPDPEGNMYYALDKTELIADLIAAVQLQHEEIENLKERMKKYEQSV